MRAFSVKCAHFHLICIKCTHFQENACILCKLDENARIFTKNARILCKWKCVHFPENARKCAHFPKNARKCAHFTKDLTQQGNFHFHLVQKMYLSSGSRGTRAHLTPPFLRPKIIFRGPNYTFLHLNNTKFFKKILPHFARHTI